MDMGTAVRCYIEKRSFLGEHSYKKTIGLQYGKWLVRKLFKNLVCVYIYPTISIREMQENVLRNLLFGFPCSLFCSLGSYLDKGFHIHSQGNPSGSCVRL
jgi:hypothetical protein